MAALDISNLASIVRLDDPNETQPIIGPHYVKLSPDKKNLLVTGYFVQAGDVRDSLSPPPSALIQPTGIRPLKIPCADTYPARSRFSTPPPTTRATGSMSPPTVPSPSTAPSTSSRSSPTGAVLGRIAPSSTT